jgi:predicted lipid-binding transport protein (Tim44 family)
MDAQLKNALAEGVVDALGFVAGGLAGGLIARLLGADFMGEQGWGAASIAGILLVGLGAGLGKTAARKLLRRTPAAASEPAASKGKTIATGGKAGKR